MKSISLFTLLAGSAAAFFGQLSLDTTCNSGEGCQTILGLTDFNTGSTYSCGNVVPSFCSSEGRCPVFCQETSPGGFNFNAQFWQTSDGCDNIDFEGNLDAGHGFCCGGAPCTFSA